MGSNKLHQRVRRRAGSRGRGDLGARLVGRLADPALAPVIPVYAAGVLRAELDVYKHRHTYTRPRRLPSTRRKPILYAHAVALIKCFFNIQNHTMQWYRMMTVFV